MSQLGRRYAKALFALALEEQSTEAIGSELSALEEALAASEELASLLSSPAVPTSVRKEIFADVGAKLGTGTTVRNFVNLMIDRNRASILTDAIGAYRERLDQHVGRVRAEVVSARKLRKEQVDRVKSKLEQMTGKDVVLEVREDKSLIGGLVARVGSTVYDGSLKTRVDGLRRAMIEGSA